MNRANLEPLHVLIVDDNDIDRAEAKSALTRGSTRRYRFSEAASALETLRLCQQAPLPDCIVLDLGLPDADEFEVLSRLPRDSDGLLRVPVVVLTASMELGLGQAALRAGAQDYVGKAWLLPETLTQAVENAIERLRMAREIATQRRAAEASRGHALQLEAENRHVHEANRLKSSFLANMSHELRTPLTAVIGFSDLLKSGQVAPDSPKHQAFLGHIATSGRHLLQLINDVLDLSKIEAGKFEFFAEPFDLATLIKEARDGLHLELQHKKLRFRNDTEPSLGSVTLDRSRLKQILNNYLSNAIKFTPAGGLITVRARDLAPCHFELEVEDTGIGIAPSDIPRLFTAYQQLDAGSAKRYQGSGLGLAITRQLAMAQGGSVNVRSTLGSGSIFQLVLNRVHGTDAARDDVSELRLTSSAGSA
jgi:signal transduction histidine kinase